MLNFPLFLSFLSRSYLPREFHFWICKSDIVQTHFSSGYNDRGASKLHFSSLFLFRLFCWPRGSTENVTELKTGCFGITTTPLAQNQALEFLLLGPHMPYQASCLVVGITTVSTLPDPLPTTLAALPTLTYYVKGKRIFVLFFIELPPLAKHFSQKKNKISQFFNCWKKLFYYILINSMPSSH